MNKARSAYLSRTILSRVENNVVLWESVASQCIANKLVQKKTFINRFKTIPCRIFLMSPISRWSGATISVANASKATTEGKDYWIHTAGLRRLLCHIARGFGFSLFCRPRNFLLFAERYWDLSDTCRTTEWRQWTAELRAYMVVLATYQEYVRKEHKLKPAAVVQWRVSTESEDCLKSVMKPTQSRRIFTGTFSGS